MKRRNVGKPVSATVRRIPAGTIIMWPALEIPKGWLYCNGDAYSQSAYPELFSAIGTNYGTGGVGAFRVPNFLGRTPYGASPSRSLNTTNSIDTTSHTLTAAESARRNHTHDYSESFQNTQYGSCTGGARNGTKNQATANEFSSYTSANAAQSHTNLQPYILLNFIIKT